MPPSLHGVSSTSPTAAKRSKPSTMNDQRKKNGTKKKKRQPSLSWNDEEHAKCVQKESMWTPFTSSLSSTSFSLHFSLSSFISHIFRKIRQPKKKQLRTKRRKLPPKSTTPRKLNRVSTSSVFKKWENQQPPLSSSTWTPKRTMYRVHNYHHESLSPSVSFTLAWCVENVFWIGCTVQYTKVQEKKKIGVCVAHKRKMKGSS